MNKKLVYPYFLLVLNYVIGVLIIVASYKILNIVTYILVMTLPICVGTLLFVFAVRKYIKQLNILCHALIAAGLYMLFYSIVIMFVKKLNVTDMIYQNSIKLFTSGFSIGNNLQLSIGDAVMPSLLTFIIHYGSMVAVRRLKNVNKN